MSESVSQFSGGNGDIKSSYASKNKTNPYQPVFKWITPLKATLSLTHSLTHSHYPHQDPMIYYATVGLLDPEHLYKPYVVG